MIFKISKSEEKSQNLKLIASLLCFYIYNLFLISYFSQFPGQAECMPPCLNLQPSNSQKKITAQHSPDSVGGRGQEIEEARWPFDLHPTPMTIRVVLLTKLTTPCVGFNLVGPQCQLPILCRTFSPFNIFRIYSPFVKKSKYTHLLGWVKK